MGATLSEAGLASKSVTPDEIAHYQALGWVKLEKFVHLEQVNNLLAIAKDKMGEKGD